MPEQVALIGIDNDPLTRTLTRVPLSSVIQGTETMGRTAARLLHQMLHGMPSTGTQILIPPDAVNVQASSLHQPLGNPYVMQAMLFIRQYACQGIKTAQVAAYVGVSRSSLESHFRRARGCSVHDEILRFKLAAAANGLEKTDSAIAEIARDCGFKSAQYLHTVFRREFWVHAEGVSGEGECGGAPLAELHPSSSHQAYCPEVRRQIRVHQVTVGHGEVPLHAPCDTP